MVPTPAITPARSAHAQKRSRAAASLSRGAPALTRLSYAPLPCAHPRAAQSLVRARRHDTVGAHVCMRGEPQARGAGTARRDASMFPPPLVSA